MKARKFVYSLGIALALLMLVAVSFPLHPVAADPLSTDPKDDLVTDGGLAVTIPYMDIVKYQLTVSTDRMSISGDYDIYNATFVMAGAIPAAVNGFVEWDVLVDADYNVMTHPCGTFWVIDHNIGVDYVVRVYLTGSRAVAESYTCDDNGGKQVYTAIPLAAFGASSVSLFFRLVSIGNASVFDYVFVVQQKTRPDYRLTSNGFARADVAPNSGSLSFGGYVPVPEFSLAPLAMFGALAVPLGLLRRRKSAKN